MPAASQSHSKMSRALCYIHGHLLGVGTCPQHVPAGSTACHSTDPWKKTKFFSQALHVWTTTSQTICSLTDQNDRAAERRLLTFARHIFPPKLMKHFALWTSLLPSCISTDHISHLSNFILETWAEQGPGVCYPCQFSQKIFPISLQKDSQVHFCYMKLFIRHAAQIQTIYITYIEFRNHILKWRWFQ